MTTYSIEHPSKGLISYTDKKRHLWWLSVLFAAVPFLVIGVYYQYQNPWILLAPLLLLYGVVPAIDYLVGTDKTNPPEEIVPQLAQDNYYRFPLYINILVHYSAAIAAAYVVATEPLSLGFVIGFAVVMGMYGGGAINTAHEIGHKNSKRERAISRLSLALCGYGHFCIEHNLGHHRDVSTPEDPASSRMGESIYSFMWREIPGAAKRGWNAERDRLTRKNLGVFTHHNQILQSYALTLLWQGALVLWLGWILIPFFIIHNVFAWLQLTSANYIEHYGLLREKKENGRYERCQPHHSWNANHIVSNLLFYQLERHSDHHANPSRPYQSLRAFDDLPELPSGYPGMYWLAYHPFLWFKVMDKRLLAVPHINGDFSKINVDPKKEAELKAKYA